ncbi:flagellar hook protein FliD [Pseudomonas protegens]|jgi:flagellar hook-associated protein 2|uniref:Flagellar hook-associated protein 2 n=3 Tax=Pseudomonas protegens TaxID=380021 RepID=Q4KG76_PSEF5|nr:MULTISPECIES: flagellar filament capping protein FliD [Pseudomonas]BCQ60287.1 flagellar hook-associated protein 2 [Pseudomonas sp. Boi14]AAY90928.1 flagellar hook-associated protein 2 [Pseudomonas protegens Pf-5]AGL83457.1 A-type flagellar hook-associated protein 2 [Pseudomonas protegens CHA0]ASE24804.1 flagellar hook protein FliD [Pseudomonas protegens]MBF0638977.1 flagellar filament capping protein FliD [Pseudomonas protegens]
MASPILPGTGLGSGLDTGAIVKALVAADKAAKQGQIDRATTTNSASISGIGTLQSLLSTFQSTLSVAGLGSSVNPAFAGFAATSSDSKTVDATADNYAVAGKYSVTVKNLATSSKVASAAFSGGNTSAIPSGTLNITQNGINYPLTVGANATLQSVRDSINADSKMNMAGLSANIVTDSFGSRLVIGSEKTGAGTDISVSGIAGLEIDGTQPMSSDTNPASAASSGNIGGLAKDAVFSVDGMQLTSKTNTVTQAISGLKLNLVAPTTTPITVTVATNTEGLKTSIQKFVDAYNAVANGITTLTKPSLDDSGNPTIPAQLTGDSLPRSILAAIRAPLSETGAGDKLTVLAQLGITTNQKTGALDFDDKKFTAAMTDKKLGGEVQKLFTGDGTNPGLLERMTNAIKPFTQGVGSMTEGILTTRTKTLDITKKKLSDQQDALDRRVATLTAVLTKKYNDMDTLVGKLKATASNITSMFEALTAQQKG